MSKIHIAGLGPGGLGQLTLESYTLIKNHKTWLRTAVHPCAQELKAEGVSFESFDSLYDTLPSFEAVYSAAADRLIALAETHGEIVYAVPGNPLFGEESVKRLIQNCKEAGVDYTVYPAASFVDAVMEAVELDPVDGLTVTDAFAVINKEAPVRLDPKLATLITQVYDGYMASEVKLALNIPEDTPIWFVSHAGLPDERVVQIPLYELDRQNCDHLCSVVVPALPDHTRSFDRLRDITRALRMPDGCPWDREQTHATLRKNLLEEAYEVIAAIEAEDDENLCEELGDLLFQVMIHAQLADEEGAFNVDDVVGGITEKMIRRHPHVFGHAEAETSEDVITNWEAIKKKEKKAQSASALLKDVPQSFTALMRADKLQSRAAKAGFDWDDPSEALEKVREETSEVSEELGRVPVQEKALEEELGDLLFACVNTARLAGVDAEQALRLANDKFLTRFTAMEDLAASEGKCFSALSLDEQEVLWQRVKHAAE